MGLAIDLSGFKINKILVLHYLESRNNRRRYFCLCECGKQKDISSGANNRRPRVK